MNKHPTRALLAELEHVETLLNRPHIASESRTALESARSTLQQRLADLRRQTREAAVSKPA